MKNMNKYENCLLCPRKCGINRSTGQTGVCGVSSEIKVARAALHYWEEPCISGKRGSGAVFFSGCSLHCVFCQNREISDGKEGKVISKERLSDIFIELAGKGANNINLVTPGQYIPDIVWAVNDAKSRGMKLPIIYNTSGYENVTELKWMCIFRILNIWTVRFRQGIQGQKIIRLSQSRRFQRWSGSSRMS